MDSEFVVTMNTKQLESFAYKATGKMIESLMPSIDWNKCEPKQILKAQKEVVATLIQVNRYAI